ncbi:MAG: hypothetical protein ABIJ16_09650 [Bacteroidota bacterium]
MKKLLFILFAVCAISVYAQNEYGPKAGLNIAGNFPMNDTRIIPAYHTGAYMYYTIKDDLYFQGEIMNSVKGCTYVISPNETDRFYFKYIDVPVMIAYNEKIWYHAGLEFSYVIGATVQHSFIPTGLGGPATVTSSDIKFDCSRYNLSVIAGINPLLFNRWRIGVRGVFTPTRVYKNQDIEIHHITLEITLQYNLKNMTSD